IFVEGVDIIPWNRPGSYIEQQNGPKFGWGPKWIDKVNDIGGHLEHGAGMTFYAANSVPDGAQYIHVVLEELGFVGYTGKITLVGQSNGAGAIFHYFANAESYPGDKDVEKFVAFDAPTGRFDDGLKYAAENVYWAQWDSTVDVAIANVYIKK